MFLMDLVDALRDGQIPYCVVGGMAVNLHGVPRTTYDVDIVISVTLESLSRAADAFTALGLVPRLPLQLEQFSSPEFRREMLEQRNLVAMTFTDPKDPLREVDVLVNPPIDVDRLVNGAITMTFTGKPIRVVSRDDLIAMKEASGRRQDLDDVSHLRRLS